MAEHRESLPIVVDHDGPKPEFDGFRLFDGHDALALSAPRAPHAGYFHGLIS